MARENISKITTISSTYRFSFLSTLGGMSTSSLFGNECGIDIRTAKGGCLRKRKRPDEITSIYHPSPRRHLVEPTSINTTLTYRTESCKLVRLDWILRHGRYYCSAGVVSIQRPAPLGCRHWRSMQGSGGYNSARAEVRRFRD